MNFTGNTSCHCYRGHTVTAAFDVENEWFSYQGKAQTFPVSFNLKTLYVKTSSLKAELYSSDV